MANTIELILGNKIYSGWKTLNVTRSLEDMAGQFSLGVTVKHGDSPRVLMPGQSCQLEINGQRVITGYVDTVETRIDDERTITVSGRDKTGDLVDCAAIHGKGQWRNVTLETIAKDLCKPFSVVVRWEVKTASAATVFKQWQIEPGETVFDNLSRAARHRGVLVTSNALGELVFTTAGTEKAGVLVLGPADSQGVKIQTIDTYLTWVDRFSLYRVKGSNAAGGLWGETQTPAQSTAINIDVRDAEITRYRPTIILADDNLTTAKGNARGSWEQKRSLAHGVTATVGVTGWFKPNSQLWQPNERVTLNAQPAGLNEKELLIVSVNYTLDNDAGTVTKLELMPRDGFNEPAQPEPKINDGMWK